MADQYDDGGYTELAGGWCVPDSQMTGWPFGPRLPSRHYPDGILADEHGFAHTSIGYVPITARRGGIKYPTPVKLKGTAMSSLNSQLTTLKNKQENLAAEIANLERKIKTRRTAPPLIQSAWTIDVRFTTDGKLYRYLIVRVAGRFYTTGTGDDGVFTSWTDLLDWLDGMNEHSALVPLRHDYIVPAPLEGRRA